MANETAWFDSTFVTGWAEEDDELEAGAPLRSAW